MENAASKTPKSPRPILVIAGSLVAIAVVVYFSFFYPPVPASDTEGTIGAVKKYHTEQISEQDVVLDAMTSTNEAVVAKAISQTNAKIAENAFVLSKAAEEALADAKMAKFRSYCEGVQNMAREAEKMAKRTEGVASEAKKLNEMATELASQAEAMKKTGEQMKEAASLSEGVAVLSRGIHQAQELGIRGEFIAVSAEARRMLDRMESSLAEGSREEASQILAAAAQEFGRRGEALQVLGRAGEAKEVLAVAQQLSSQAEAVKAGGNMRQALESSQVLVGKIETLALPEAARRDADR